MQDRFQKIGAALMKNMFFHLTMDGVIKLIKSKELATDPHSIRAKVEETLTEVQQTLLTSIKVAAGHPYEGNLFSDPKKNADFEKVIKKGNSFIKGVKATLDEGFTEEEVVQFYTMMLSEKEQIVQMVMDSLLPKGT